MPRPKLNPSEEQRRQVKSMAAIGIPHEDIALKIGIRSPQTLRKHFREELDSGKLEAKVQISKTLFQMANSGECVAATIFWLKTHGGICERRAEEIRQVALPPFVVTCEQGGQPHDHA